MLRTIPVCSGVAIFLAVAACCSGGEETRSPSSVCSGDYSELDGSTVSLERDLVPIFKGSCVFSSCHDASAHEAGFVLGDPKTIRDELLAQSTTEPSLPRVTPYDPTKSFLLDKLTGNQNERGYSGCANQLPSNGAGACGDVMPPNTGGLCADQPQKVIAIARWILAGAPQN